MIHSTPTKGVFISLLFIFCLSNFIPKANDGEWELVKDEDEIEVYTRLTEGSPIKEVKVKMQVASDLHSFMDLLNDVDRYTEWVYKCIEAKKVETINPLEFYYYTESDFPFPVSNRDMVIHSKQIVHLEDKHISTDSQSKPKKVPEVKGVVRIKHFTSSWNIKVISENLLEIEYEASTDPGGYLPAWIINLGIASAPLKTMQGLKEILGDD